VWTIRSTFDTKDIFRRGSCRVRLKPGRGAGRDPG
jgi:hypothetical protein